jgi:hypothetical protein
MGEVCVNKILLGGIVAFFGLLSGCTCAYVKQITSIGSSGHIVCYSGGQKIYEGDSTGKIATESQSDGWYFEEKVTNRLIRISGDCLITN